MNGATSKGSQPGFGFPSVRGVRWILVLGFVVAIILTVILKPWQRELVPAEQVSRNQLVLQQGRLMKTSQTNTFTGLMVEFYPDGTLQSRSVVSNGLLHGVSEGWHTNGGLAITEGFLEGRSNGTRTKWDAASNRIAETDIRAGEIEGLHREWHTNGKPSMEVTMARGKAHGVARKWSLGGELAGQWVMSNGVVIQAITNATELGALTQTGGRP